VVETLSVTGVNAFAAQYSKPRTPCRDA
jgi:hypothetical protein